MLPPRQPADEADRLQALRDTGLLDTPAEERFDRLTRLARQMLDVPIALVSLVDAERQWFKSRQGLDACEAGRDVSFCGHAILDDGLFVVEDAHLDPRFADNPLVTAPPRVRFYAGAPLATARGRRIGTLCVIDHQARQLTPEQRQALRDLADCVQAEIERLDDREFSARLAPSEAQFRALADAAPALIWVSDTRNHGTWYNRRWLEYTGRRIEQELGTGWAEGVHPDDLGRCVLACNGAFEARRRFEMEFRLRRADGSYGWIADTGIPHFGDDGRFLGYIGYCWDITDRKEAEAILRDSEHRLAFLMASSPVAIYACETVPPFAATFISPNVVVVAGWPPERFLEDPGFWLDHVHPDDRERVLADLPHLFESDFHHHEYRFLRADGEYVWIADDLRLLRDADGRPAEMIGSWRDMSEQKRVERMKSEFVSTVSHELRTPLTAISGAIGLLAAGVMGSFTDEVLELLTIAEGNTRHLRRLIDDLLDMEKLESGKLRLHKRRQALMPIVAQALRDNRGYAERFGVTFSCDDPAPDVDVDVEVDADRLRQVLANLLANAAKFSPRGGNVVVSVKADEGAARIAVSDQGPGVPLHFRSRIFERFSQADASDGRARGGSGLGLAISRELVERMHGRIGFESDEGKGATFWVELPLLASMPEPAGTDRVATGDGAP